MAKTIESLDFSQVPEEEEESLPKGPTLDLSEIPGIPPASPEERTSGSTIGLYLGEQYKRQTFDRAGGSTFTPDPEDPDGSFDRLLERLNKQQQAVQNDYVPIPDPLSDEEIQVMQEAPLETAVREVGDFIWSDILGSFDAGIRIGAQGFYQRLDNLTKIVSSATGLPETDLFEWLAKDVAPTDTPKELHEKVVAGLGSAVVEIPQWAIAMAAGGAGGSALAARLGLSGNLAKVLGENAAVGTLGALTSSHEGAGAAAKSAAEFMLLNGVLQSTASMTRGFRMGTMGTVFGGQAAANGEDVQGVSSAAITGMVLGAMGRNGDIGFSDVVSGRLVRDASFRKYMNSVKGVNVDMELAHEGAMAYLKKYHPSMYDKVVAEGIGKPTLKVGPEGSARGADAFINQLNAELGTKLGIKPGSALGFRERAKMLFDRADPKGHIPQGERTKLLDQLAADVQNLNAQFNATIKQPDPLTSTLKPAERLTDTAKAPQAKRRPEPPAFKSALDVRTEREAGERRAANYIQRSNEATERTNQTIRKKLLKAPQALKEGLLDTGASERRILRRLIQEGNPLARRAQVERDLAAGFAARGAMYFQDAKQRIFNLKRWYEHPSKEFETDVGGAVLARSLIHIAKRKPAEAYKVVGGEQTFRDMVSWYENLSGRLGAKRAQEVDAAASRYFAEYPKISKRLLKEGIISKESFDRLKEIEHLPIEYMNRIDPAATEAKGFLTPRPITVGESGIRLLEGGSKAYRNTDIVGLLQQSIIRAEGRIARNRANKALYDLAQTSAGKGFLRLQGKQPEGIKLTHDKQGRLEQWDQIKAPENFEKVSVFLDGKQTPLFIHKEFARGWRDVPPAIAQSVATTARVLSGSAVVRPLATGFNPFFALTNFPRDIVHATLVSPEYSAFLPRVVGQMARDLWTVRKDAFGPKNRGRLREYLEEGGGMNFLTHQGTDILGVRHEGGRPFETSHPRWENFKTTMSKMNEVSELWVRLAVRERSLRNQTGGKPGEATLEQRRLATHEARNYLDFSQGGRFTKAADHAIPYLNASMQATRTVFRSARDNPVRFISYLAQLQMLDAVARYVAAQQNPEGYAQISPRDKRRSILFNTDLSFVDPRGNTRWVYGTLPIDPSIAFFLAPGRWALDRELFGMTPLPHEVSWWENQREAIKELVPFLTEQGLPMPPTMEAFITGATNHDLFFDRSVWGGPEVPYEDEVREPGSLGKPTPALSRYIAESLSSLGFNDTFLSSPERVDAMVRKVVPNHFMAMGADWLANELRYGNEDLYKYLQSETQQWVESPGVRRTVSVTHPAEVTSEALNDTGKEASSRSLRQNNKLDNMVEEMFRGETSRREIQRWIRGNEDLLFSDKNRLNERMEDAIELRRMFGDKGSNELPGGLPQNWWLNLKRLPADERAEIFWKYWKQQPAEEKQRMWNTAIRLRYHKDRYSEFYRRFKELRKLGGDHEEDGS